MRTAGLRSLLIAVLAMGAVLAGCERHALDRKMAALCAKDGGVKVYETVTLSASDYEALGRYATAKNREDYLGPQFRFIDESSVVIGAENDPEKGRGQIIRSYIAIYRRADGRLLAESVSYGRLGGDGVTFGLHPSQNHCPKPRISLKRSVFKKAKGTSVADASVKPTRSPLEPSPH